MSYLYHATDSVKLNNILESGLEVNRDGFVFFADNAEGAINCIFFQHFKHIAIIVIETDDIDESLLRETCHNSADTFGCIVYKFEGSIKPDIFKRYAMVEDIEVRRIELFYRQMIHLYNKISNI